MHINTPKVSVIMPVRNTEKYVGEAIESILSQTFTDFEFIIIDDGSTDNSLEIIKNYASKDDRIQVIVNKVNLGQPKSLNKGIALAKGKYIARMDADDISLPERFSKQVEYLDSCLKVNILGGQCDKIDSEGTITSPCGKYPPVVFRWRAMFATERTVCHPATMMRKNYLITIGKYPDSEPFSQDLALWTKASLSDNFAMHNLNDVIIRYRTSLNQVSHKHRKLQNNSALEARSYPIENLLGIKLDTSVIEQLYTSHPERLTIEQRHECFRIWKLLFGKFTNRYHCSKSEMQYTKYRYVEKTYTYLSKDKINNFINILRLMMISPSYFRDRISLHF